MWRKARGADLGSRPHPLAVATSTRFHDAVQSSRCVFDEAQSAAIAQLAKPPLHGFYISGDVGRGKSMLSDLYFDAVPTDDKRRYHFHSFFRDLHDEIVRTRSSLEASIDAVLGGTRMIFFDEFHVHDMADSLYLAKALEVLRTREMLVLATSNYAPQQLMPNPLFHDSFLPTIALIESLYRVVTLGEGPDYRRTKSDGGHAGFRSGRWTISSAQTVPRSDIPLAFGDIALHAVDISEGAVTFTFAELCEKPVGIREYLAIAEDFTALHLIAVPDLADAEREPLMRLCNLIDVFYDRDRRLDVCSAAEAERMRDAAEPPYDADRSLSRLATLSADLA